MSTQRLEVEKLKAQMIKHGVAAKQQPSFASTDNVENVDVNIRPPLATLGVTGTAEKDPRKRTLDRDAPGTGANSTVEMR